MYKPVCTTATFTGRVTCPVVGQTESAADSGTGTVVSRRLRQDGGTDPVPARKGVGRGTGVLALEHRVGPTVVVALKQCHS